MGIELNKGFFTKLSAESNCNNRDITRNYYYALIRLIMKETANNEKIVLPDFGTFTLKISVPRIIRGRYNESPKYSKASKMIKFKPCERLRHYFRDKI